VKGRIDRWDGSPTGEIQAYDYKYSANKKLLEKYPLQGPLYALALGGRLSRFAYVALREEAKMAVLEGAELDVRRGEALVEMRRIVEEAGAGLVRVAPLGDACKYCEYRGVCRIDARVLAVAEEELAEEAGEF
jgi:RecB family exonuclease